MKTKAVVFTKPFTAEYVEIEVAEEPGPKEVLVHTAVSTVSPGTERAVISDIPNTGGHKLHVFPRQTGYSSAGIVVKVGSEVTSVAPGDRVLVFWGDHQEYQMKSEDRIVKIEDEKISFESAAMTFISTFPLAAVRKCRVEIGESVLVMGLGLLGQFAVRLLRAAGAAPVIAADPVASRREEALKGGADYAVDPFEEGFAEKVKMLSGGKGVAAAIEVTGVGAGLDETLDCMAKFGRVALLGCTRSSDFTIDYYRKVHCPGITLIGAHTNARPKEDSYPGWFTARDDIKAVLKLLAMGRLDFSSLSYDGNVFSPEECPAVYDRIVNDRSFPTLAQFDWRRVWEK